ncbi:ATP synthase F1 subunit delta [Spirosoma montaniterrae]|uniref:ATP synthase subunit delta n=1 Tax=Spirosoma montaniterrae TaxID=1178516 RepID=A0A1P9WRG7_9BACT|nr:ATP synthase F1 subunit delta [Spirosoma montaniterrae]AQG77966.1 ATP synthase F1 subunit delta [Spirosoma montaniterrae]
MAVATVASRYAKSLLDLAKEQGITDTLYADMKFFRNTLTDNRQLNLILKNPIVRAEKKNAIVKSVFGNRLSPVMMSFLGIVARKNREAIVDSIADEFISQYDRMKGIQHAVVITTMPLTESLRETFKAMIAKETGLTQIELEERIDPKLIGGYVLRIGDRQIDGSIRSQLNNIRLQFMN